MNEDNQLTTTTTNESKIVMAFSDLEKMAEVWTKSGFTNINREQAMVLLLTAQSEGMHPIKAMQTYDVIKGRPALKSSAILARFNEAGGKIEWLESNSKIAKCKATSKNGNHITIEWNMNRAKTAGLLDKGINKGPSAWEKYPDQMLRARAQVEAIRAIAPEVLNGHYVVEEVQFFDDKEQSSKKDSISTKFKTIEIDLGEAFCTFGEYEGFQLKDIPKDDLITLGKDLAKKEKNQTLTIDEKIFLDQARNYLKSKK